MLKEKTRKLIRHYISFFFYLAIILSACLILFYPRIFSTLVTQKRADSWNKLEQNIKVSNKVDPRQYWLFREFYNTGNFSFSPRGFDSKTANALLQNLDLPIDPNTILVPFLIYRSPYLTSLDSLVTINSLDKIMDPKSVELVTQYKGDNVTVLKHGPSYILLFVLPVSEMQKANGFYDMSQPETVKLLKDKYWLNISEIKLQ